MLALLRIKARANLPRNYIPIPFCRAQRPFFNSLPPSALFRAADVELIHSLWPAGGEVIIYPAVLQRGQTGLCLVISGRPGEAVGGSTVHVGGIAGSN